MRVAIVHDWLTVVGGAERSLEQILQVFPDADLFSLVDFLPKEERSCILHKTVKTSFIQRLPFAKKRYRDYLIFMPLAIEQFDVSGYDLVISSSHAVAKGVLTSPEQLHLCYCYSPMRYAWDLHHQYLNESKLDTGLKGWIAKMILHRMRLWDQHASHRVDHFMAISSFISKRIHKTYRREAKVIYPPVDIERFKLCEKKEEFYLTAQRMVPYKKIDLIVEAFNQLPHKHLIVIGDGPDFKKIKKIAKKNITLLGHQPRGVLMDYMQLAKAFVFAAKEDFGIAPLEAQACGTPVIGLKKGALLETVRGLDHECPTGAFFEEQTVHSVHHAIEQFEKNQSRISPVNCRENALRFSPERFRLEFKAFVEHCLKESK
jgi:glycosyltransferase involved in cell wall biosynthesis